MTSLDWILKEKIVAILRGVDPASMHHIVQALYEGGITVLEITLNSSNALALISSLVKEHKGKMLIGAGTVLDAESAHKAREAGAAFIISPGLDREVVSYSKQHNLVSIPGAFTPTEIIAAHRAGADIVKIFPVNNAEYIKNVSAPLDHIRMMPTGGINTENIHQFSKAGAVAFGIGSALVSKTSVVNDEYLSEITRRALSLRRAVDSF